MTGYIVARLHGFPERPWRRQRVFFKSLSNTEAFEKMKSDEIVHISFSSLGNLIQFFTNSTKGFSLRPGRSPANELTGACQDQNSCPLRRLRRISQSTPAVHITPPCGPYQQCPSAACPRTSRQDTHHQLCLPVCPRLPSPNSLVSLRA